MGIFDTPKMLMCTLFFGGGGSQKVYGLYTCENVDIYGRPLRLVDKSVKFMFQQNIPKDQNVQISEIK